MQKAIRTAESALQSIDPVMARLIEQHGPCTLFANNSLIHRSHFHVLVWAIVNQQLSVASAGSIENRLSELIQSETFEPDAISIQRDRDLAACGLSRQKIRYIRALCESIERGELDLEQLAKMDNEPVSEALSILPGIGPWTVDMFLMFSLGRLDVLPLGDLALRKSIAHHYELPTNPEIQDYHAIADRWRPYRTISSWYLWAAVD
ncbi:MAG: DNA-3-methyladenine glycosylase 2 family protein [Thiotrichales bacterium]|nr:MAG: DNA-3-methyladenine glycosylase 2 family protein [Thiotrichales bacterium]